MYGHFIWRMLVFDDISMDLYANEMYIIIYQKLCRKNDNMDWGQRLGKSIVVIVIIIVIVITVIIITTTNVILNMAFEKDIKICEVSI